MIPCTDEEAGILPFHEWKAIRYAMDQAAGTPHTKEWYYSRYGGYCEEMRKRWQKSNPGFRREYTCYNCELSIGELELQIWYEGKVRHQTCPKRTVN